jgi:hypothetical protein
MTKLIFNLPDSTVESWKHVAKLSGLSMTEALRQMIHGHQLLLQEVKAGHKMLLQSPDGQMYRQVLGF